MYPSNNFLWERYINYEKSCGAVLFNNESGKIKYVITKSKDQ